MIKLENLNENKNCAFFLTLKYSGILRQIDQTEALTTFFFISSIL